MSDLIDRQAAIEVIDAVFPADPMQSVYAQGIALGAALAKTYVEQLPSAQPDSLGRPSARWTSVGHKRARICSHCFRDEPYKFADHDADIYDFCPHCGADMRGRKGERNEN